MPTLTLRNYFETWKERHKQNDDQLAAYLGISTEQLALLEAEVVPGDVPGGTRWFGKDTWPDDPSPADSAPPPAADRHGVNVQRLYDVLLIEMHDGEHEDRKSAPASGGVLERKSTMTSTLTLGDYFGAWMRNHEQSEADLAAALRVSIDQLPALAAETVEITEVAPESEVEQERPIPIAPLPGELLAISKRHGVDFDRLVNLVNGRVITG